MRNRLPSFKRCWHERRRRWFENADGYPKQRAVVREIGAKTRFKVVSDPEHADTEDAPAVAFSRPHEIEIERFSPGLSGIPVQLNRLLVVGPTARLELEREDSSQIIEAELPAEKARHLKLRQGETLLIRPNKLQVFVERDRVPDSEKTLPPRVADKSLEPLPSFGTVLW